MTESKVLPKSVADKFLPYFEKLKEFHGVNLISVFVYGSATGENFIAASSDINSVFVFKKVDFKVLQESLSFVTPGFKKRISAPLFLTREDITSSLDIFPIEFLEMKENYVQIYGEDILASVQVDDANIRIFCEQQIKGKLIRLRQAYFSAGRHHQSLSALLAETLNTLFPIFRNILRLKAKTPPTGKSEIIRQLCAEFGLQENAFMVIYRHKSGEKLMDKDILSEHFANFLGELSALAQKVDAL